MYFGNLAAEQARRRITNEQLAAAIGKSRESLDKKLAGDVEFKLNEMNAIKFTYFPQCTLDYLFEDCSEHGETA